MRRTASRVWATEASSSNNSVMLPRTRVLATTKDPPSCKDSRDEKLFGLTGLLLGGRGVVRDGSTFDVDRVVFGIRVASSPNNFVALPMVRVLATTTNPPSCKGSLFDNEWALRGPPAGREARNSRGTCRRPSRVWDTASFKLNYSVVLPRARVLATTKAPPTCMDSRDEN
jgi:hypothetical protein